ncbi:MAG: hypothetical protein EXS67_00575 [Candidatus Margulisbacteria bacterium]|nr:hypothetical protein [Candidatus Margulisiibacteriota bacterium]
MNIGIFGSSDPAETDAFEMARRLGEWIARDGHAVVTGACLGVPFEAVKGVKSQKGMSIGFTAVTSPEAHEKEMGTPLSHYDRLECIPKDYQYYDRLSVCKKYRNVSSLAFCDVALFISGRWGTLNEFSIAYDMGKVMGVLTGIGKFSSKAESLVRFFNKDSDARIIYRETPELLYEDIMRILHER